MESIGQRFTVVNGQLLDHGQPADLQEVANLASHAVKYQQECDIMMSALNEVVRTALPAINTARDALRVVRGM